MRVPGGADVDSSAKAAAAALLELGLAANIMELGLRLARSQAQILQPAMLNARGIVTQYGKLLRVHTKLICRYAQDLRKRTPLAR